MAEGTGAEHAGPTGPAGPRDGARGGAAAAPAGLAVDEATLDELFERPPRPRLRVGVGAAVVLVLVVLGIAIAATALRPSHSLADRPDLGATPSGPPGATAGAPGPSSASPGPVAAGTGKDAAVVFVHVLGAVRAPGVYELPAGSRVVDAVSRAGGLAEDAEPAGVNLARVVVDGEQVRIPRQGEAPVTAATGASPGGAAPGSAGSVSAPGAPAALINLNTAGAAELDALPRVGPVMAQRIVDYRTANGPFRSVDDLKQVSGIGDATFAGIAPLVTV